MMIHCCSWYFIIFHREFHFDLPPKGFFSAKAVSHSQAEGHCGKWSEETLRGTGVRGGLLSGFPKGRCMTAAESFEKTYWLGMLKSYVLTYTNLVIWYNMYFINPCRRKVFKNDLLPSLMMSWSPWEDWLNRTDDTYSLGVHLMARFGSPACEDSWPLHHRDSIHGTMIQL